MNCIGLQYPQLIKYAQDHPECKPLIPYKRAIWNIINSPKQASLVREALPPKQAAVWRLLVRETKSPNVPFHLAQYLLTAPSNIRKQAIIDYYAILFTEEEFKDYMELIDNPNAKQIVLKYIGNSILKEDNQYYYYKNTKFLTRERFDEMTLEIGGDVSSTLYQLLEKIILRIIIVPQVPERIPRDFDFLAETVDFEDTYTSW
jgi:hypothetical protein